MKNYNVSERENSIFCSLMDRRFLKSTLYFFFFIFFEKSVPLAVKSSQCSFSSSLLHWGTWWERFLQERIFVRWQATSFTFSMIYLSRTISGKWKFIWTNSKLQSQLGTMLAICERGDTQPGEIGPVKCLEWPKRSHFTSHAFPPAISLAL